MTLSRSCAILTGAGGGIGRAIAKILAADGHAVVVVDIDEPAITALAQELDQGDCPAMAIAADLRDPDAPRRIVARTAEWHGSSPGVLVNNAGLLQRTDSQAIGEREWSDVIAVNLTAAQAMTAAVLPGMRERAAGVIVNIASISGLLSVPGLSAYTAAKHGVIGLTRALGSDLAPLGIRVNAVAPGLVETEMTRHFLDRPALRAAMEKAVPLGRIGRPDDIARVVRFLVSDDSAYVTGAVIVVDGGFSVTKSFVS